MAPRIRADSVNLRFERGGIANELKLGDLCYHATSKWEAPMYQPEGKFTTELALRLHPVGSPWTNMGRALVSRKQVFGSQVWAC